ncbi:MAG: dihydropteroate synthase [Candidatus Fimadaptatus sp.]|jgi:5-methyltetrahydrofolate--homocysteine methyltransferase
MSIPSLPRLTVIGQCINPSRADVADALRAGDYDALARLARAQFDAGAQCIDICAAMPGIDEAHALREVLERVSSACPKVLPVLDSPDCDVLCRALKGWHGGIILNSTTAEPHKLERMLTLAGEHGAQLIVLAMRDRPGDVRARLDALRYAVRRADSMGFARDRLIADCLVLAECRQPGQALITLDALTCARDELGVRTLLGISNTSAGMPGREAINSALLSMAASRGLDYAMIDPLNAGIADTVNALRLLMGEDEDGTGYISRWRGMHTGQ